MTTLRSGVKNLREQANKRTSELAFTSKKNGRGKRIASPIAAEHQAFEETSWSLGKAIGFKEASFDNCGTRGGWDGFSYSSRESTQCCYLEP